MKRSLSLILAALISVSSMTACGNTEPSAPVETAAEETAKKETDVSETEALPSSCSADKITENGIAKAHIVIAKNAGTLERYAAEELVYHIKKVSGAEVSVTNAVQTDSLPIIIAAPESYPELETLFPDDLSWLRDTGAEGSAERWGDDGFAIRLLDNKLYIFGATPRGVLNGVYDFIEDNMGVLWTRADESIGLIYDEMPSISITKADYREKSPFDVRSWTLASNSTETQVMLSRNKLNAYTCTPAAIEDALPFADIGMEPYITSHNLKWWIQNSPAYDPDESEYWNTDSSGSHVTADKSPQVNFWSEKAADTLAASVIAFIDTYKEFTDLTYVGICIEDNSDVCVIPEDSQPFEYAPGQFVDSSAANFKSTVFYAFLNKIARKVAEVYPDVTIHTYAYAFAEICPECEIEDNIAITIASINEDLTSSLFDSDSLRNSVIYNNLEAWKKKTSDLIFYNYYGCFIAATVYERPIWDLIKEHLTYYRDNGFLGLVPEGIGDVNTKTPGHSYLRDGMFVNKSADTPHTFSDIWAMNSLTFWLYSKLSWNPDEDIDALIQYFCDKCYGDASPYMQEYYRLLKGGWDEGMPAFKEDYPGYIYYNTDPMYFVDFFLFNSDFEEYANLPDRMLAALNNAMEDANKTEKERIRYIKENLEVFIEEFSW